MNNKHLKPILLILIAITLLVTIAGCQSEGGITLSKPEPTVTPIPQQPVAIQKPTYEVQRGTIIQIENLIGRVGPVNTVSIAFGSDGRVDELNFSAGDMVQAGDLIAKYDNLQDLERDTTLREIAVRRAEIGVERAQLYLDMTLENRYAKESDIQLKEWDLELAQLSYQELMISLGEQLASVEAAKLIAPMDGMIIDSKVRVNQIFSANDDVMTIADVSNLAVLVDSYTVNVDELKEGMSVILEVYNGSETYVGTIQQIPYPYGTGPARDIDKYIYIYFDNPDDAEGWKINDRFDITVEITRVEDILWLPPQAIREFSGRTFVMVEEGDKQVSIDIELGLTNGEMTEIVEGLEEGQVIIGQ